MVCVWISKLSFKTLQKCLLPSLSSAKIFTYLCRSFIQALLSHKFWRSRKKSSFCFVFVDVESRLPRADVTVRITNMAYDFHFWGKFRKVQGLQAHTVIFDLLITGWKNTIFSKPKDDFNSLLKHNLYGVIKYRIAWQYHGEISRPKNWDFISKT